MESTDPLTEPGINYRERQRQVDQSRLDTFVIRARRIEAHSLAQDLGRLSRLSGGDMKLTYSEGKTSIKFDYPPEEEIESAAARVRPLLLDDVSMPSALKAIRSLTSDSGDRDPIRAWVKERRETWNRRTGNVSAEPGYVAFVHSTETGESGSADQLQLALAWIYGDVVHHDPAHLERTKLWGVSERFRGAVPLVAYIMIEAINVLMNIREMEKRGALTVTPEAWTVAVVAEENFEREVTLYIGEIGAEEPTSATEPPGSGWSLFDPDESIANEADDQATD